jgi:hypothetical protein
VPQLNPLPLVYFSALFVVLQLGSATAVGLALDPVAFATTVFAACAPRPLSVTPPHAGGVEGPVETMACPAVEPAGFRSCTGLSVAAIAPAAASENASEAIRRFMECPYT